MAGWEAGDPGQHPIRLALTQIDTAHDTAGTGNGPAGKGAAGGGGGAGVGTAAWMRSRLKISPARAHTEVRAATVLDRDRGDLRELGDALAAGRTSADTSGSPPPP